MQTGSAMRAAGSHRETQNIRVSLAVAQATRTSNCALASRDTAAGVACHALAFLRDMHRTRACQCCPPADVAGTRGRERSATARGCAWRGWALCAPVKTSCVITEQSDRARCRVQKRIVIEPSAPSGEHRERARTHTFTHLRTAPLGARSSPRERTAWVGRRAVCRCVSSPPSPQAARS